MNIKTKKIIAREGLIILGLIALGATQEIATVFVLNTTLAFKNPEIAKQEKLEFIQRYEQEKREALQKEAVINKLPADATPVKPAEYTIQDPKGRHAIYTVEKTGKMHGHYIYDAGQTASKAFSFLIFGYPFYLLFRFIIWAIKTLKNGKN